MKTRQVLLVLLCLMLSLAPASAKKKNKDDADAAPVPALDPAAKKRKVYLSVAIVFLAVLAVSAIMYWLTLRLP